MKLFSLNAAQFYENRNRLVVVSKWNRLAKIARIAGIAKIAIIFLAPVFNFGNYPTLAILAISLWRGRMSATKKREKGKDRS